MEAMKVRRKTTALYHTRPGPVLPRSTQSLTVSDYHRSQELVFRRHDQRGTNGWGSSSLLGCFQFTITVLCTCMPYLALSGHVCRDVDCLLRTSKRVAWKQSYKDMARHFG